jgi:hypothetical protein
MTALTLRYKTADKLDRTLTHLVHQGDHKTAAMDIVMEAERRVRNGFRPMSAEEINSVLAVWVQYNRI